jgi:hypothetical protein
MKFSWNYLNSWGLETFKCVEEFLKNVLALIGGEV